MSTERVIAVLLHPTRPEAFSAARTFITAMTQAGIKCVSFDEEWERLTAELPDALLAPIELVDTAELAVVFGGDGTILRAADWAHPRRVPLLGVNLGHVGFLAELEPSDLDRLIDQVLHKTYAVEERFTIKVRVLDHSGKMLWESFAVNELSLEKRSRQRMLQILVSIDEQPLSRWSCDGILVATPTGSTAYAFSAGGPVIWPDVQAFLVIPLSAHALFSRPLVLGPQTVVDLRLEPTGDGGGVAWCDGRRTFDAPETAQVRISQGDHPLYIARLSVQPFTSRLVAKFGLPVKGWRSQPGGE